MSLTPAACPVFDALAPGSAQAVSPEADVACVAERGVRDATLAMRHACIRRGHTAFLKANTPITSFLTDALNRSSAA